MFPFRILLVRHMLTFIRVSRYMLAYNEDFVSWRFCSIHFIL